MLDNTERVVYIVCNRGTPHMITRCEAVDEAEKCVLCSHGFVIWI